MKFLAVPLNTYSKNSLISTRDINGFIHVTFLLDIQDCVHNYGELLWEDILTTLLSLYSRSKSTMAPIADQFQGHMW